MMGGRDATVTGPLKRLTPLPPLLPDFAWDFGTQQARILVVVLSGAVGPTGVGGGGSRRQKWLAEADSQCGPATTGGTCHDDTPEV
jgi:hypothetical protein